MARKSHARARAADVGGGAPARSLWTGSISFGLLQIPVALYPAEQRAEEIHFRMLDKNDLSPIRLERVNASTGKPVAWKDIVKGYAWEPDTYVVVEPEDLAKANVKATQTIELQDIVPRAEIDPTFFETPYWIVPQKRATKAYALLRDALAKKDAVAIATFVLRTREHLVALMPARGALLLEVLRFGHELRAAEDMPLAKDETRASSRELAMAEQLVSGMMTAWDPSRYEDRWHDDVMAIIEEKARRGKTTEHHARARGEVATDVVDLLELLKKSVAGKGAGAKGANGANAKKAARRGGGKKHEAA
jgi:DNA end-binding protein Ku